MNAALPPPMPSCQTGGGVVYRAECASRVHVVIAHQDTLGRPLPEGIAVEVIDSHHRSHHGVTDANGTSQHSGVMAGPFAWQLHDALGRHLVAIDANPVHPVAAGLAAPETLAVMPETVVTAVYLPPPIRVDLRAPRDDTAADLLSDEPLETLRLNGNNATLFVHGYNVGAGDWARFSNTPETAGVGGPFLTGAPLLRPGGAASVSTLCQSQAPDADTQTLNGSGACSWLVNMEYQLNRAAGMPDDDWRAYTRVVAIAWPGDTGATDFVEAEFSAMRSGRRLVNVLQQLIDADLSINIVSHSLGARVVLTALNLLGDRLSGQCVDNLFLWEPAVADNALSPDSPFTERALKGGFDARTGRDAPGREAHPLGMGTFPSAHRSVKNIVVLHSHEDGTLGPSEKDTLVAGIHPVELYHSVSALAGDTQDDRLGKVGGAYPKKWWTFPPLIAGGLGYFRDYYFERGRALAPGQWEAAFLVRYQQRARDDAHVQHLVDRAWEALKQAIIAEARRVAATLPAGPRLPGTPLPEYDLLKPLSHHYKVGELMASRFADQLRPLGQRDNWQPRDTGVRPALGLVGFKNIDKEPFFRDNLRAGRFNFVDQSTWLFSHSAMKYPSAEIFIKSYQDGIMAKIKRNSRFGKY